MGQQFDGQRYECAPCGAISWFNGAEAHHRSRIRCTKCGSYSIFFSPVKPGRGSIQTKNGTGRTLGSGSRLRTPQEGLARSLDPEMFERSPEARIKINQNRYVAFLRKTGKCYVRDDPNPERKARRMAGIWRSAHKRYKERAAAWGSPKNPDPKRSSS